MKFLPVLFLLISLTGFAKDKVYTSEGQKFVVENLLQQGDVIWGFDFLADQRIIFTERSGKVFIYDTKSKAKVSVSGVPEVNAVGQGGLLDIRVHPTNGFIYLTYSEKVKNLATTAMGRGKLEGDKIVGFQKLFAAHEPNDNDIHYGSRIIFDGKGHVLFTVGDRDNRERAQDLKYHQGKIIRLNEDGSVPKDNPFITNKEAKPEIYSLGHRSPQGFFIHPTTNEIWEAEMGPRGGDEINFIKAGANYGWPVVTFGREYYGPKIGTTEKAGMEAPVEHWVPSISPSGMMLYTGDKFPKWKGNIFLGTLSSTQIRRLVVDGKKVSKQEPLLEDLEWRFRNLRTGPDGNLYYSTDEGRLGRLVPAL